MYKWHSVTLLNYLLQTTQLKYCLKSLQTDRQTDRPTHRPTDIYKAICPLFFIGGHKNFNREHKTFTKTLDRDGILDVHFTVNKQSLSCWFISQTVKKTKGGDNQRILNPDFMGFKIKEHFKTLVLLSSAFFKIKRKTSFKDYSSISEMYFLHEAFELDTRFPHEIH